MSETIVCPSGLSGRIRPMKVREERIFTDRKLSRQGGQLEALLASCWEETLEPGPYNFGNETIKWDDVLQGDRFFSLLQLRTVTYGPNYEFAVACDNKACNVRIDWELNLTDLPVRPLSEESRIAFLDGNRFAAELPHAQRRVWFRLLTGADERKLAGMGRQLDDRRISKMLSYRISQVEDVAPQDKLSFIEDLSFRDVDYLLDEFDRVECGVETGIEVECPQCLTVQEVELPFDESFFVPGRKRRKRRRGLTNSSLG